MKHKRRTTWQPTMTSYERQQAAAFITAGTIIAIIYGATITWATLYLGGAL